MSPARHLRLPAWVALAAVLAAIGYLLLFSLLVNYDDEGYVLWSVRQFCAGQPLYTEVYSQYGPFFFVLYRLLDGITRVVSDNDTARLFTLGYWCATALISGALARRATQSTLAGLVAAVLTFASLSTMASEPFHPGSLLCMLVALALFLAAPVWALFHMGRVGYLCYAYGDHLALAGATRIRLMPRQTTTVTTLVRNARAYSATLFTFPGMLSFNIWAEKPTPTRPHLPFSSASPACQNRVTPVTGFWREKLMRPFALCLATLGYEGGSTPTRLAASLVSCWNSSLCSPVCSSAPPWVGSSPNPAPPPPPSARASWRPN